MSSLTYEQIRDYILVKFKTAWDANTSAVNGGLVPAVEYQNIAAAKSQLANGNIAWARAIVRFAGGNQRSMGTQGNRLFTHQGLVTVQIFVPAGKQGLVLADRLGKIATDAFEGEETSTGSAWFRNTSYREVGVDDGWFQVNVTAEFEYDAVK